MRYELMYHPSVEDNGFCRDYAMSEFVECTSEEALERVHELERRGYAARIERIEDEVSEPEPIDDEFYDYERWCEEQEEPDWIDEPRFKIILTTGWTTKDFCGDLTEEEAYSYCDERNWEYYDANGFRWDMSVVNE